MGKRSRSKRRALQPALYRPERAEIVRQADQYVARCERRDRRNRVAAVAILSLFGSGLVVGVLSALGLLL